VKKALSLSTRGGDLKDRQDKGGPTGGEKKPPLFFTRQSREEKEEVLLFFFGRAPTTKGVDSPSSASRAKRELPISPPRGIDTLPAAASGSGEGYSLSLSSSQKKKKAQPWVKEKTVDTSIYAEEQCPLSLPCKGGERGCIARWEGCKERGGLFFVGGYLSFAGETRPKIGRGKKIFCYVHVSDTKKKKRISGVK